MPLAIRETTHQPSGGLKIKRFVVILQPKQKTQPLVIYLFNFKLIYVCNL